MWRVFSEVVKLDGAVEHTGEGGMYDYHESIVNALRPALKKGIKSIVVAAPARTDYARNLLITSENIMHGLFEEALMLRPSEN